jgi:hypothetical protein
MRSLGSSLIAVFRLVQPHHVSMPRDTQQLVALVGQRSMFALSLRGHRVLMSERMVSAQINRPVKAVCLILTHICIGT